MVSMELEEEGAQQPICKSPDNTISSPRISFSCDLLDDASFISINLTPVKTEDENVKQSINSNKSRSQQDFEFLAGDRTQRDMPTADELFFEGKLLPYWQTHHSEKMRSLRLKSEEIEAAASEDKEAVAAAGKNENRVRTWFIDDDPSPRPPKCTVLWKELLRLKTRQKGSTLSPSSSSSSSSSSSLDMSKEKEKERESNVGNNVKNVKRVKKGLERTRSASIRIRPMVNVPICTQSSKQRTLPPLFPLKRSGR